MPYSRTWPRWGTTHSGVAYPQPTSGHPTDATAGGASPTWPTPTASGGDKGGRGDLLARVRTGKTSRRREWPTPTASDAEVGGEATDKRPSGAKGTVNLPGAVKTWPTPTARLGDPIRGMPSAELAERRLKSGRSNLDDAVAAGNGNSASPGQPPSPTVGGALNPEWVELLQGFPIGWTEVDC